ncbi:MAG: hypothetical protein AAF907_06145 [Planctomycetota bacterium]
MSAARIAVPLLLSAGLLAVGCGKKKDDLPPEVEAALKGEEPPAPPKEQKRGIVGRKTIEILNAKEVLAAGTHSIAQEKIGEGSPLGEGDVYTDPISGPLNVLGRVSAFAGQYQIQGWVNGEYALNGKYPTYDQVIAYLERNPQFALPMPRLSQRYAYDETRGAMLVLDVLGWEAADGGSLDMDGERVVPINE